MKRPIFPAPPFVIVLLLWVAGLGAAAQFGKVSVLLAGVQAIYPERGSEIGLLVSLIGFLGILFGLFAGLLVARVGFRAMLIAALVLGGFISVLQAPGLPFGLMLVSRVIEGISHLVIVVAAPTMIAMVSPPHRLGMAMTLWSTFFGVSFALMAWLAVPAAAAHGVGVVFAAHGVFLIVVALLVWLFVPGGETETTGRPLRATDIVSAHRRAYASPFIAAPASGWLFYTTAFVALLSVLPLIVAETERAFIATAMPLVSILAALLAGRFLLPHLSAVAITVLGFASGVAVVVMAGLGLPLATASIALFAVLGLVQGASFAAVPQLNHGASDQALANGAMAQMGNLGNTIGTPLFLALVASFGLSGLLIGASLLFAAGMAAHLLLARRRRRVGL